MAIGDLPRLAAGAGLEEIDYPLNQRERYLEKVHVLAQSRSVAPPTAAEISR